MKTSTEGEINATEMARRHGVDKSYVSRVIRLSFLSPKLVEQLLEGKQHADLDAKSLLHLRSLPTSWREQERLFLNR